MSCRDSNPGLSDLKPYIFKRPVVWENDLVDFLIQNHLECILKMWISSVDDSQQQTLAQEASGGAQRCAPELRTLGKPNTHLNSSFEKELLIYLWDKKMGTCLQAGFAGCWGSWASLCSGNWPAKVWMSPLVPLSLLTAFSLVTSAFAQCDPYGKECGDQLGSCLLKSW
jgi:hypothetical protein